MLHEGYELNFPPRHPLGYAYLAYPIYSMTYALSGMQTPHTPYCVGLTLSPPAPLGFAYPEYTIFATSYTLSGMHFLSSPPTPLGYAYNAFPRKDML